MGITCVARAAPRPTSSFRFRRPLRLGGETYCTTSATVGACDVLASVAVTVTV
jgi:hypothetical protein